MKESNIDYLEFLGRSSIFLIVLFIAKKTIVDYLYGNWWFALGSLIIVMWMFIPFFKGEKNDIIDKSNKEDKK